jgi:Protein of unknown function (DUF2752)
MGEAEARVVASSVDMVQTASGRPVQTADDPLGGIFLRLLALGLRPATSLPVALLVGACIPVAWVTGGPQLCPFKLILGLPCPGCGMTRSVVTLLHGDLAASLYFHPLGLPLVLFLASLALLDGLAWWRSTRPGQHPLPASWLPERVMLTPTPWTF